MLLNITCPTFLFAEMEEWSNVSVVLLLKVKAWRLTADRLHTYTTDAQNNLNGKTQENTLAQAFKRSSRNYSLAFAKRTRRSFCFSPQTVGLCRLGGHGTTITSKRPWQHQTNSLTKAASTTHLHSAWHTLMCKCVCACSLSSNSYSIFSRWEHRGYIWFCYHGLLLGPHHDQFQQWIQF